MLVGPDRKDENHLFMKSREQLTAKVDKSYNYNLTQIQINWSGCVKAPHGVGLPTADNQLVSALPISLC